MTHFCLGSQVQRPRFFKSSPFSSSLPGRRETLGQFLSLSPVSSSVRWQGLGETGVVDLKVPLSSDIQRFHDLSPVSELVLEILGLSGETLQTGAANTDEHTALYIHRISWGPPTTPTILVSILLTENQGSERLHNWLTILLQNFASWR